ncbi:hypothetical protein DV735_g2007, partial [Chaetothyriales sp. CBS 134920]
MASSTAADFDSIQVMEEDTQQARKIKYILDRSIESILHNILLEVHQDEKISRMQTAVIELEQKAELVGKKVTVEAIEDAAGDEGEPVETKTAVLRSGQVHLKGNPMKTVKTVRCPNCRLPRLLYPRVGFNSRPVPDPSQQYCKAEPMIILDKHDVHGQRKKGVKAKGLPKGKNKKKNEPGSPASENSDPLTPSSSQPGESFEYKEIDYPAAKCPNRDSHLGDHWKSVNIFATHLNGSCYLKRDRQAGREANARIGGTPKDSRASSPKASAANGIKRKAADEDGEKVSKKKQKISEPKAKAKGAAGIPSKLRESSTNVDIDERANGSPLKAEHDDTIEVQPKANEAGSEPLVKLKLKLSTTANRVGESANLHRSRTASTVANMAGPPRLRYADVGINLGDPVFRGIYHGKQAHPDDQKDVIQRALDVGCTKLMITGSNLEESKHAVSLAEQNPGVCYATVGVHPCSTTDFDTYPDGPDALLSELKKVAIAARSSGHAVAFGEFGLDYDRLFLSPKEVQLKYFEKQLGLAVELQMPLFLHSRACSADFERLLAARLDQLPKTNRGLVHSFTGSLDEMHRLLALGFHIGVNGCSLKTDENLAVVKEIPLDRLQIETDGPWCEIRASHASSKYLRDADYDGSALPKAVKKEKWQPGLMVKGRNEPATIVQVAHIVAKIKGLSVDQVAQAAWENSTEIDLEIVRVCAKTRPAELPSITDSLPIPLEVQRYSLACTGRRHRLTSTAKLALNIVLYNSTTPATML